MTSLSEHFHGNLSTRRAKEEGKKKDHRIMQTERDPGRSLVQPPSPRVTACVILCIINEKSNVFWEHSRFSDPLQTELPKHCRNI